MPALCFLLAFMLLAGSDPSSDDEIKEIVFRYQMDQLKAPAYYLAFGISKNGKFVAPSGEFMQRFVGDPKVKPFTDEKFVSPDNAVILSVDSVERKNNKAEVAARFVFLDVTKSAAGFYQLELKRGIWKVTGKKSMKIMPA